MSAKQRGDRKIKGSLGDITFRRNKNGNYTAFDKPESIAGKIATDPRFKRTRENGAEFGRAGVAGKLIRDAIRSKTVLVSDSGALPRLLKELMRVIKSDTVNDRGLRTISAGEIGILEGFDFNITAPLSIILPAPFTATIDRVAGSLQLNVPGFIPTKLMKVPMGATHFKFTSLGMELDFDSGQFIADAKTSPDIPWNNDVFGDISLTTTVTPNSTKKLFLLVGLEFNQLVNGKFYQMTSGNFNSMKIVKVSGS